MRKKLISIVVSICLLCTLTSATNLPASAIGLDASYGNMNLTEYDSVLNEYFSQRELLYTTASTEFDARR